MKKRQAKGKCFLVWHRRLNREFLNLTKWAVLLVGVLTLFLRLNAFEKGDNDLLHAFDLMIETAYQLIDDFRRRCL